MAEAAERLQLMVWTISISSPERTNGKALLFTTYDRRKEGAPCNGGRLPNARPRGSGRLFATMAAANSWPDADRIWASIGGTYQFTDTVAMDFGYSHVFVQDASLERNLTTGTPPTLFANTRSSVDVFSVGFSMKLGGSPGMK